MFGGELIVLAHSIHMVFSILWWSTTMIVIFVIRPSNKTGILFPILPKIRKLIIFTSSISIFSGLILYGLLSNLNFQSYFYSSHGFNILVSGSFSLIVYFHILRGSRHKLVSMNNSFEKQIKKYTPFIMFGLLTFTMVLMILTSTIYNPS